MAKLPTTRTHVDHDGLTDDEVSYIQRWTDDCAHFAAMHSPAGPRPPIEEATMEIVKSCFMMNMSPEEAAFLCDRIHKESTLF